MLTLTVKIFTMLKSGLKLVKVFINYILLSFTYQKTLQTEYNEALDRIQQLENNLNESKSNKKLHKTEINKSLIKRYNEIDKNKGHKMSNFFASGGTILLANFGKLLMAIDILAQA
jgi:translation initiation factor 2B subunit (eIF-2B alpha/beta/delta family)